MTRKDHQNADKKITPHIYRIYIPTKAAGHGLVFEDQHVAEAHFDAAIASLPPLHRTGCELQRWIPSGVLIRHAGDDNITR